MTPAGSQRPWDPTHRAFVHQGHLGGLVHTGQQLPVVAAVWGHRSLSCKETQEPFGGWTLRQGSPRGAHRGKRGSHLPRDDIEPREEAWPGLASLAVRLQVWGPLKSPACLCRESRQAGCCLPSPQASLPCEDHPLPPLQQRKLLLSATSTSPSALRGQRPRGAHGPSFGRLPRWPGSSAGLYHCRPAARH